MNLPSWDAVLTFFGGVFVTVITATASRPLRRAQAKQNDREGEASLAQATMEWARHLEETLSRRIANLQEDYGKKFDAMSERMETLEVENDMYRRHNTLLTGQLVEAGISPVPMPEVKVIRPPSSPGDTHGET